MLLHPALKTDEDRGSWEGTAGAGSGDGHCGEADPAVRGRPRPEERMDGKLDVGSP